MILGSMSNQNVKAATTTDPTSTENTTASSTTSQSTSSSVTSGTTVGTTATTQPASSSTTSGTTAGTTTTSQSASSSVTSGTTVGTTATTQPASSSTTSGTTSGTTTTSHPASSSTTSGTTSGTTTTSQPASSSVTSGTTAGSAATQPTSSSVTTTATTGNTTSGSTGTSVTINPTTTTGTTTATTTAPISYAIPSNVTDATVVNFTDQNLEYAVKNAMNIPYNSDLTIGDIKNYASTNLQVSMDSYDLAHPDGPTSTAKPGSYISDENSTPIESLNGMQYLQLLPTKTGITFQALLACDPNANTDLTPLDNLNLTSFDLAGDFSDPSAKEIDVSQISKLNLSKSSALDLEGSEPGNGIDQQELNELAPTINSYANNGQGFNMIELDNSSISDFSPLKGTETGKSVMIDAVSNTINDPTTAYAVDGQPITFTASKLLDPNGTDIANKYTYSPTVQKADNKDDDLINTAGTDNFTLNNADPTAKALSYGNYGFNNGYASDSAVREQLGNTYFEVATTINQPLIWQANPTVTIDYLDSTGKPITNNGVALTKTIDGTTIGSAFDLTGDSQVAGYTLTSPTTLLKGTYTEAPQTIDLTYKVIPESSSETTTPVKTPQTTVIPSTGELVKIRDITGNTTASAYLSDIGVHGVTTINGKKFYLLGDGEFVEARDYDAVTSKAAGIVRTFGTTVDLVDAAGHPIDAKLAPNTEWKYDKIVAIRGKGYYEVANNEFLPVDRAVSFTPTTAVTNVTLGTKAVVYDSQGHKLTATLPSGSTWRTDGCAIINGIKMYRVATDEYISATNTNTYTPTAIDYRSTAITTLYDQNGQPLRATLPANTSWKVDRVVMINGQRYYRVATNEFVKA